MTRRTTKILGISGSVKLVRLYRHTVTLYLGGRRIGGEVRENNANPFLLRMANLLIFIHNGRIEKLLYSPNFKMVLTFLVTKVFQKGTMFK